MAVVRSVAQAVLLVAAVMTRVDAFGTMQIRMLLRLLTEAGTPESKHALLQNRVSHYGTASMRGNDSVSHANAFRYANPLPIRGLGEVLTNSTQERLRNQGKSYKQIRQIGKFTEAESTLRGRYRTLTKSRRGRR